MIKKLSLSGESTCEPVTPLFSLGVDDADVALTPKALDVSQFPEEIKNKFVPAVVPVKDAIDIFNGDACNISRGKYSGLWNSVSAAVNILDSAFKYILKRHLRGSGEVALVYARYDMLVHTDRARELFSDGVVSAVTLDTCYRALYKVARALRGLFICMGIFVDPTVFNLVRVREIKMQLGKEVAGFNASHLDVQNACELLRKSYTITDVYEEAGCEFIALDIEDVACLVIYDKSCSRYSIDPKCTVFSFSCEEFIDNYKW